MMMWYVAPDNKKSTIIAQEGKQALLRFKEKYNRKPSVIFINPKNQLEEIKGIKIIEDETVLVNHLYIAEKESDREPEEKDVNYRGIEDYN